ncbi:hypothetical protein VZH09_00480 [Synechococcus elongatus IITB7]|uniref:hypothetical protein n=1 Tax=Synechococcus elongatus TaxID=32046 RepID=UPI0030D0668A
MPAATVLPLTWVWSKAMDLDSDALGRYISATEGVSKPWLLLQLRLKKLKDDRDRMEPAAYEAAIAELHQALMDLGEWWVGREAEVFGGEEPHDD